MRIDHLIAGAALVAGAAACTTGSTFQSGVGDRLLEHPPFYAGTRAPGDTARLAHLPVAWQGGATQEPMFEPADGAGTPIAAFLDELTRYLDSLGASAALRPGGAPRGAPPDVQFSCETDGSGDCLVGDGALGRGDIRMRLAVARPAADWVAWAGAAMDSARAGALLVVTLEIGQYRLGQRGLRGDKVVELGSGHTASLPWLTSLETPVHVLQLTGALVGRDGRAIRIGAEGLLARRTSLPGSALGAERLITDAEVAEARTARRADLPGQPLVWQTALGTLVAELTGRAAR